MAGHPLAVQWMNLKETQQRPANNGNQGSKGGGLTGKTTCGEGQSDSEAIARGSEKRKRQ